MQPFSRIFSYIQRHQCISFIHTHRGATRGWGLSCCFLNIKKKKKPWLCPSLGLNFTFKMYLCSCVVFYLWFDKMFIKKPSFHETSPTPKNSALTHYSFCKTLHLKYLTVFWICLCLNNCSIVCTVTICYVPHETHSEFSSIFRTLCKTCIFTTLPYSKPWHI